MDTKKLEQHADALDRVGNAMEKIADQVARLGSEGLAEVKVVQVGEVMDCTAYFGRQEIRVKDDAKGDTDYVMPEFLAGG